MPTPKNGPCSNTFWNVCKPGTCWFSTAISPRWGSLSASRARWLFRWPTASNEPARQARQQTGQVRGDGDGQDLRADRASRRSRHRHNVALARIEVRLFEETRNGEKTIGLLTNLPETVSAVAIAEIYRQRWTIETQFQFLTVSLHCEVPGLGKPKAALFAFAMSLVASNALAVVRASLRAAHGKEAEAEVSGYYLADEVAAEYRTLAKYLPAEKWKGWRESGAKEMASLLTEIARQVNMAELHRNQRGPKKPPDKKPVYNRKHKHFSTYRLIE